MKFGVFYEHQIPRPWTSGRGGTEHVHFMNALDQIELADKLGYDYAWQVEHHFLEEYSHGSAPEVFLAAASQRTKNIRLGHGVMQLTTNQPHRVAEKVATLDLLSNGRVDLGLGESSTSVELHPFGRRFRDKREVFEEAVQAILPMFTETDWEWHGEYFDFPARNVLPKPIQEPHPPLWVACSNLHTIEYAARMGMGALAFQFVDPENARAWVHKYYRTVSGPLEQLTPHPVNANLAMVCGFMCAPTDEEAQARSAGWTFFQFALSYYGTNSFPGSGTVDMWAMYEEWVEERRRQGKPPTPGLIGSPETIRSTLRTFADAGVDQVILLNQAGRNTHEDICSSLELFAETVMPEFHAEEDAHSAWKADVMSGRTILEDLDVGSINRYAVHVAEPKRPDLKVLKAELDARDAQRANAAAGAERR